MNHAFAEASQYLDPAMKGFFSIMADGKQHSYPLGELESILDTLPANCGNAYISQNSFRVPTRRLVNLNQIGICYTDLDIYNAPAYRTLTPEQQARNVLFYCEDNGILRPSYINSSGRGLHVKWLLDDSIPAAALPRWNAVERYLVDKFADFGVDRGARDASRLLRMVGSTNPRSGQETRTVWQNESGENVVRYDFEIICDETLPFTRKELAAKRKAAKEKRNNRATSANLWTPQELWWRRYMDLLRLIELRGWTGGVPAGYRNNFLLIAAHAVIYNADQSKWEEEIHELATEFVPSLTPYEVRTYTSSAIRQARTGNPYRFTNDKIIEMLDITASEQSSLKHLAAKEIRDCRKKERDRLNHRKHSDRQTYEANAQANRERVRQLRAEGQKPRSISELTGLTVTQVNNYLHRK